MKHSSYELYSLLNHQIKPSSVKIEVTFLFQIPQVYIIGLPGPEVSEAKERIQCAIRSSQLELPNKKVVINLAPASIRKQSTGLDLAMALSILLNKDQPSAPIKVFAWGELGINGEIKPMGQTLRAYSAAHFEKVDFILLHPDDFYKLNHKLIHFKQLQNESIHFITATTLKEALDHIRKQRTTPLNPHPPTDQNLSKDLNSSLLPLHPYLARALGMALASKHHFLILGPKGIGKSQLNEWAEALYSMLAPSYSLEREWILEWSGAKNASALRKVSPSIRPQALTGGIKNSQLIAGEMNLAHEGILFADEFPEWHRDSRELLREPLEKKIFTLSRLHERLEVPSQFILIANGNLCPCGGTQNAPEEKHSSVCQCKMSEKSQYMKRISGPLLDRIEIRIILNQRLTYDPSHPSLQQLYEKIISARAFMKSHWGNWIGLLKASELERIIQSNPALLKLLEAESFTSLRERHQLARVLLSLSAWHETLVFDLKLLKTAKQYRMEF